MKALSEYITEAQYQSAYLSSHEGEIPKDVFICIKPGFIDKAPQIMDKFKRAGFMIKAWRTKQLTIGEAKKMYYVHKDEDFYYKLCKYMASCPCMGIIMEYFGEGKVFDIVAKLKDQIREQFGEDDMRNCMHSSDNPENMRKEMKVFF